MLESIKKERKKPKGSGRKPLSDKERLKRLKATKKAYRLSTKEFKCRIDPMLFEELRMYKSRKKFTYEEMLRFMLENLKKNTDFYPKF